MLFRRFTSERVRQQRRKRLVVFSVVYILLAVASFVFVWQVSNADFLQITSMSITGEKTIPHAEIVTVVQQELAGSYAHLFSKRNTFLYPRSKIQEKIQTLFPSAQKVFVTTDATHTLTIRIEERKGVAVACALGNETRAEECYFIDDTAFIFIPAPHFSGSSYVTYALTLSASPLGTYAFPPEEFALLDSFITSLATLGMRATRIELQDDGLTLFVTTPRRGTLKLLVQRNTVSYDDALRNLETVIESEDFKKASELEHVEYIDLRFGNKVFYKEKERVEDVAPLQTATPELKRLE